jgi:hypothetical protein
VAARSRQAASRAYHDKQWVAKMKSVGVQPSSTGVPGGKETGGHMSHYLVPDGPFARAFAELAATGWGLQWQSAHRPGASGRGNASKTKCTRTACKQNAWGRSDLAIMCKPCRLDMVDVSHVSVSYDQQPGGVGGRYG